MLRDLGEQFSEGEIFLPQLFMAGEIMELAGKPITDAITKNQGDVPSKGTIVIGSVKGDVHDIGKNMVRTMFKASGFDIVDLGVDVPTQSFIDEVKKSTPDILAISSTMSTTVPMMRDIIDFTESAGLREKMKIIVGGGSMNQMLADEMGADGYSDDANGAAKLALSLMDN